MGNFLQEFQESHIEEYGFMYTGDLRIHADVGNINGYWSGRTISIPSIDNTDEILWAVEILSYFLKKEDPNKEYDVCNLWIETSGLKHDLQF
jgi:hypothetical protein